MIRFFVLGIGIGIGVFGVFLLSLMPVVSLESENEILISSANNNHSWGAFTSALGIDVSAKRIPADEMTLPNWVSLPNGAFGVRTSTSAIHRGGPGRVTLTFSIDEEPEILQEFYETLFLSKGLNVVDRLEPSDPMFNIVVNISAVDRQTDRSARLIIRDQLGVRVANLTFTTNGDIGGPLRPVAVR